jgi:diguanylate cyclase (GGDEF)-like protein/PAS domain S-box-containing protein
MIEEGLLKDMLDMITEGVYFVDMERRITYWNKSAERITGYSAAEVIGKRCHENILRHVDDCGKEMCIAGCPLAAVLASGEVRSGEFYLHHKNGHRVPVFVRGVPHAPGDTGPEAGAIEIFTDRSERVAILAELEDLRKESLTDQLTGLGNRRYVDIQFDSLLERYRREGTRFGFLISDIDRFKLVNDKWGHATGDRVLRMVAWTIANAVRRGDVAARWGGEEFVVLTPGATPPELQMVAERIRALVERSWLTLEDGRKLEVTVSVGGAMANPGDDMATLTERADRRLYRCKDGGRNKSLVGD